MTNNEASILIVDDDTDVSELLAAILSARKYFVRIAHDGQEGLDMLCEDSPDVVILDVEMPHLTGPQMAYRMFIEDAGKERIPIVLVSGVACLSNVSRCVGTPYYLGKPFRIAKLLGLLQKALAERLAPTPTVEL